MKYRIAVIKPDDGTDFWRCFEDPANALCLALAEAGHEVSVGHTLLPDSKNIVIGWHSLKAGEHEKVSDCIIWQLEQLNGWEERFNKPMHLDILKSASEIWDYDPANIDWLKDKGVDATHFPIGYRPEIRELSTDPRDVDVLIYGIMTVRRRDIMSIIEKECRYVYISVDNPRYSAELAPIVARSKVVINIHAHDSNLQEQVRITPVLSQGVAVVSDPSSTNHYGDGILEADDIAQATIDLVKGGWREQGMLGYDKIRSMPMVVPGA